MLLNGAMIAASTHALAKALLFICLSRPEADGALESGHNGLAIAILSALRFSSAFVGDVGRAAYAWIHWPLELYETAFKSAGSVGCIHSLLSVCADCLCAGF